MSERKWTSNQQRAIDLYGGSIIVSAAAGSGKTAVLVERVLKLITDESMHIDADKLLIVTYTKAAASELKQRLSKAIIDRIKKEPDNKYLRDQQLKLQNANISTIHSFCSSLVRDYFYILNIDRDFRIADDGELTVLKNDAMKMTLDEIYSSSDYEKLLNNFASDKDEKRLIDSILKIHEFLLSHPFPEKWMNEKLSFFNEKDVNNSVWFKEIILPYLSDALEFICSLVYISLRELKNAGFPYEKPTEIFNKYVDFVNTLKEGIETENFGLISAAIGTFEKSQMRFPRGEEYTELALLLKNNKKQITDVVADLSDIFMFTESICQEDISYLHEIAKELFSAVKIFSKNYQDIKGNRRVADYSDLEHWTIDLLYDDYEKISDIAKSLKNNFEQILVDEYQDANDTQDHIFKALAKDDEKDLFLVGDVKQSIYGFRQAMPEIFLSRREKGINSNEEIFPAKIILERNFRSEKVILDAVNYFFKKLMSESVGDIVYNDDEKLFYNEDSKAKLDSSVELDCIDLSAFVEDIDNVDINQIEAHHIANRIKEIIDSKMQVVDKIDDEKVYYRNVMYKDFAVLMRSAKESAPKYVETLNKCGIPAYAEEKYSFLQSYEIMVITNLLRIIDNPSLDIELLSVLMSPIFGFTSDDLCRIRQDRKFESLYLSLKKDAKTNEKSKAFLDELDYLRNVSVTISIADLINLIYQRTSYVSIISAASNSNIPKANLRLLVNYARDFENNTHMGLPKFVSYLDNLLSDDKDLEGGVDLDSTGENAVRVMSIHKSKGLEYPVVFLANTNKNFVSDSSEDVLFSSKYGFAIKRRDIDENCVYETFPHKSLSISTKCYEKSEELRTLYVALTRPKQKLIVLSTPYNKGLGKDKNQLDNALFKLSEKLSSCTEIQPFLVRKATCINDWILMCALLHIDGDILRERVEHYIHTDIYADFKFDIHIIDNLEMSKTKEKKVKISNEYDDELLKLLNERLSYTYRYEEILNVPSKVTATELAHKKSVVDFNKILRKPSFMENEELSAAERGTAFHAFLQFVDFKNAKVDLKAEIDRLRDKGFITDIQANSIDLGKARLFIDSELVDGCLNSEKVLREYKFTTKISPKLVDEKVPDEFSDEYVILNGSIDLAFLENGEMVIVDYKTDRVKNSDELISMYEHQLRIYKKALSEVTDYKVSSMYIYSLYLNKLIQISDKE